MGPTGWITVLMTAAILLPGLLLLFARGLIRFSNHPAVVAFSRRMHRSREEHRRNWAVGSATLAMIVGLLQWWLEQIPIGLVAAPIYLWTFSQEQPEWMRDAFPDDLTDRSDQESAGPPQSPPGR